jgi:hypothetical protein
MPWMVLCGVRSFHAPKNEMSEREVRQLGCIALKVGEVAETTPPPTCLRAHNSTNERNE